MIDSCVDFGTKREVGKYRGKEGGHIFFRPVSLIPFTKAIVRIKEKDNKSFTDIIAAFPQEVFWIQNPIWRKVIWDNDKKGMVMGHQKLVELMLLYIYDESYLSKSEKEKIANELMSIWDYHGDNVYERIHEMMRK